MASFLEYRAQDWENRRLWVAVGLSLLLHALVAILLLIEPWTWRIQPEPPPVLAEFVMPEAPKPAPPPPQAAPPPAPAPPQAMQSIEPLKDVPPPSVPQLQEAPVTQEPSRAPPSAGQRARPQASDRPQPAPLLGQSGPTTTPAPPQQARRTPPSQQATGSRQRGAPGTAAGEAGEMTQSESDFFLSQIVRAWVIDFDAPQFSTMVISGAFKVLPNGMLAPPYGKNDPWDMDVMVNGWPRLKTMRGPEADALRTGMETLMRAMRLAQPFKMPPNAEGYPKVLELNFRVGDL